MAHMVEKDLAFTFLGFLGSEKTGCRPQAECRPKREMDLDEEIVGALEDTFVRREQGIGINMEIVQALSPKRP